MPDIYGFNHLGDTFSCIEEKCDFSGFRWQMPEETRHEHFLSHYREPQIVTNLDGFKYEVQGDIRIQPCRDCGKEFSQPRRRGRPKLTCEDCSGT